VCVCVCVAALGMGLCIAFIALVRLPSLKVSTLLLVGLLIYDVFWVSFLFYSQLLIFFIIGFTSPFAILRACYVGFKMVYEGKYG